MATLTANRPAPTRFSTRSARNVRPKAPGTTFAPVAEVRETRTALVIRVRLPKGDLELSVPKAALCEPAPINRHHGPGNPDATPC
jgi:hypothetical protein